MLNTLLAAAVDPLLNNPIPDGQATKLFGLNLRDIFLVIGVAMVLGLLLFLGAYLTHRGRRHRSNHRSSKPIPGAQKPSPEAAAYRVKVRKRRRDHPENLPRNPTLGETGGLPPIRSEEPPAAQQQQG